MAKRSQRTDDRCGTERPNEDASESRPRRVKTRCFHPRLTFLAIRTLDSIHFIWQSGSVGKSEIQKRKRRDLCFCILEEEKKEEMATPMSPNKIVRSVSGTKKPMVATEKPVNVKVMVRCR